MCSHIISHESEIDTNEMLCKNNPCKWVPGRCRAKGEGEKSFPVDFFASSGMFEVATAVCGLYNNS